MATLREHVRTASAIGLDLEDLEDVVAEEEQEVGVLRSERDEAIALLKPARPEDGLLPAVRDAMQRLALTEPEVQRLRAQRKELLDALNETVDIIAMLAGGECPVSQRARAAIAKAEVES